MLINKETIQEMLPHGYAMCLVDEVIEHDLKSILCISHNWKDPENPLINKEKTLSTASLAEYGAQAAAIHSSINAHGIGKDEAAFVGAIKDLKFTNFLISTDIIELSIYAECEFNNSRGASYNFHVSSKDIVLAQGRLLLQLP